MNAQCLYFWKIYEQIYTSNSECSSHYINAWSSRVTTDCVRTVTDIYEESRRSRVWQSLLRKPKVLIRSSQKSDNRLYTRPK